MRRAVVLRVLLSVLWLVGATLYFGIVRADAEHDWLAALVVAALPIPLGWMCALLAH